MNTVYSMDWETIDELIDDRPEWFERTDEWIDEMDIIAPFLFQCTIRPIQPIGYIDPPPVAIHQDYEQQLLESFLHNDKPISDGQHWLARRLMG